MKKTVISLIIIILILGTILFYKIYNSPKKETTANSNLNKEDNIEFYHNDEENSLYQQNKMEKTNINEKNNSEENTISQYNNNIDKKNKISEKTNINKTDNDETRIAESKPKISTNSTFTNNNYSNNETVNNTTDNNYSNNKNVNNTTSEIPKNYVSINSKISGKFAGYKYYSIYFLENGYTLIQVDLTSEGKTLYSPNVEVRMYTEHYELYVEGMKNHVKVDPVYDVRTGNLVFPQIELSKYNAVLQHAAGSGVLNSSAYEPYRKKIEDIENNWTQLGIGRVLALSNYTYWEQLDNSVTERFKENVQAKVVTYKQKSYMIVDGITNYFEVKKYE